MLFFAWWFFKPSTPPLEPERKRGRVAYVIDGDTLILSRSRERLRLWGVDAPELDEKGGQNARNALIAMIGGGRVSYIKIERDRYGRTVARVFAGRQELNRALIEQGHASEYCRYSRGFYGHCRK